MSSHCYTQTSAGRIKTRTWARGISTTYGYNWGGRHTSTVSGTVSRVLNLYNRLGQVIFKTDAAGSVDRAFTPDGRLLTETNGGGILGGMMVTHSYDGLHRRTGYSATMGGSSHSVTFDYDGASLLISLSSGDDEATYTRVANAPLLSGLSRAHDSNHVVTTTWQHDFHNRLESVSSSTGAGPVSAHEYTYDALGRRVAAELGDGSGWDYGYDADGQVLSASRKRIVDESPVPGQQFAYTYDGIGNRTTAEVNGRTSVLSSNTLNQYTQRTVPGAIDLRGRALASAGVVVNDGIATRMDDAFHRTVPVDNSSGPQHPEVRVQALGAGAGPGGADLEAEEIGRVYVPGTPEVYSYDFDGNITGDGRWIYTWDFENRLVGMETVAGAPPSAKRKLEFLYDSESRRIRKRVYDWNGTAYVISSDRRYLYDGWNLMAEIVASPTPFSRTYVWGLDLSGSEQGAGGVGGLLVIREGGESHYPVYDGNGNVMALVRGSDEGISGRYHYGAFGEVLEVEETGISNPFRFSTKFEDKETGLLYYGFRYYSAETGRWLGRDPIGENGGVNLYGFTWNDPVNWVDILGQTPSYKCCTTEKIDNVGKYLDQVWPLVKWDIGIGGKCIGGKTCYNWALTGAALFNERLLNAEKACWSCATERYSKLDPAGRPRGDDGRVKFPSNNRNLWQRVFGGSDAWDDHWVIKCHGVGDDGKRTGASRLFDATAGYTGDEEGLLKDFPFTGFDREGGCGPFGCR